MIIGIYNFIPLNLDVAVKISNSEKTHQSPNCLCIVSLSAGGGPDKKGDVGAGANQQFEFVSTDVILHGMLSQRLFRSFLIS